MPTSPDQDSRLTTSSRRTILKGAAWTVPVIAVASAAPAASASTEPVPPGISVTSGGSPWTDRSTYDGYIAEGVVITVGDENGSPLAGVPTVLYFAESDGGRRPHDENFWFVSNPALSASDAQRSANQLYELTLVTDPNGQIFLDNGASPATGYLRKGSNGERNGILLVASAAGATGSALIVNSSLRGDNPGVRPGS